MSTDNKTQQIPLLAFLARPLEVKQVPAAHIALIKMVERLDNDPASDMQGVTVEISNGEVDGEDAGLHFTAYWRDLEGRTANMTFHTRPWSEEGWKATITPGYYATERGSELSAGWPPGLLTATVEWPADE